MKKNRKKLNEALIEKVKELAKGNPIFLKLGKKLPLLKRYIHLYNKFCMECKAKVMKNPNGPIEQYCPRCRDLAQSEMEIIKRGLQ